MLVQIVGEIIPQLCYNDSIQIRLKMARLFIGSEPSQFKNDLYGVIRA